MTEEQKKPEPDHEVPVVQSRANKIQGEKETVDLPSEEPSVKADPADQSLEIKVFTPSETAKESTFKVSSGDEEGGKDFFVDSLPHEEETAEEERSLPPSKNDYSTLSKAQLIKQFEFLLESRFVTPIRNEIENLKIYFYKRHKQELEKKRKQFYDEGGKVEEFQPGEDELELRFKELYKEYRRLKAVHNRDQEEQRQSNLAEKHKILEELKQLVERKEDVNTTFKEFRDLQKKWRLVGMVPQQAVKDLWENYHLYVEQFYDHIKINNELRDLDLKKNMESKITLCEKAEELLLEPSIVNAFRVLQRYHEQWREIGPVPRDQKEVIWERFREITHQLNKKHQEHYDNLRDTQKKNLEAKILLCEKAEAIGAEELQTIQKADKLTRQMLELQQVWKTIGFAPKKDNNKIYQRFRTACDVFFTQKREFNALNKELLGENLQKKLDLCLHAESLQDSTDWKKTTDEMISLQKKWKEIGSVPRRHYDSIWKRFRKACDTFFLRKNKFFANVDSIYEENLKKKMELVEKIKNFNASGDINEAMNKLKDFQRRWSEIGFVPIKEKEEIQKQYRSALDKHFESLKIDDQRKNLMRFRHKLEGLTSKPGSLNKISFEREKYLNKLKQLETDIVLWENNIGFFAKSKNADAMVKEFKLKIESGKAQIKLLEEKIIMIDNLENR